MERFVEVGELVGTAEIAERLNLKSGDLVHSWRRRYPTFPEPIAELQLGHIWAWSDVERWAEARRKT